ncbi:Disease resistance protein CC-NBS-LRR class family [Prunus dulcis]|uniref:Disease resistance protein CC-NBS-LRR class family n=1 Tax=Prunus dulcis TaxID=3755 RepID=A0A5H2XWP7_PRUDU|nr:Disease resistance protein CC-NBS-LRR class family [Prunus dulcis]
MIEFDDEMIANIVNLRPEIFEKMKELGVRMIRHCKGQFPEDLEIPAKELTQLWIAEGFISLAQQKQRLLATVEDVAYNCLSELVERRIVQVGKRGSVRKIKTCRMHDIMRDLCLWKAEKEDFLEIVSFSNIGHKPTGKVRRLALYFDGNDVELVSSRYESHDISSSVLRLSNLCNLQTLSCVSSDFCDMSDLTKLTNLRKLGIRLSRPVQNLEELLRSASSTLNRIQSLFVKNDVGVNIQEEVMQIVLSCCRIYKLKLYGPIKELSTDPQHYPNLTKLSLCECHLEDDQMAILERLPNLRILSLQSLSFQESTKTLVCSSGGFLRLETLSLEDLKTLEEWRIEEGAMPSLLQLGIRCCYRLKTVPHGLIYITSLRDFTIGRMPRTFYSRLQEGGEDFHIVRRVPCLSQQVYVALDKDHKYKLPVIKKKKRICPRPEDGTCEAMAALRRCASDETMKYIRSVNFTDWTVRAQEEPDNEPYLIGKMWKSSFCSILRVISFQVSIMGIELNQSIINSSGIDLALTYAILLNGSCTCELVVAKYFNTFVWHSPISSNILLSQIAWHAELTAATYSASANDCAMILNTSNLSRKK